MIGGSTGKMSVDEKDSSAGQLDEVALAVARIVWAGRQKADSLDAVNVVDRLDRLAEVMALQASGTALQRF